MLLMKKEKENIPCRQNIHMLNKLLNNHLKLLLKKLYLEHSAFKLTEYPSQSNTGNIRL